MLMLKFTCPSCGTKLAAVEPSDSATQVLKRTCRNHECREVWQLKVECVLSGKGLRLDKAEFTFLGRQKVVVA